ncbi:amidase [Aminobacter sp. MSH1]|uniref:amidase n=1 Tax=Aminobacter sp. MSH1 TaxID=374606 RepID=UPI001FE1983F|nr:amidase [Aminobacter sp. MSH1]
MPVGPEMPTVSALQSIAKTYGLDIDPETMAGYRELIAGTIDACRFAEGLPEHKLPVKYPRDAGWRPTPEENPLNGWAWRSNIEGASTGILKGYRIGIKDAVCVAGIPMRNGSRLLEAYVPDVDATVVTRILDAGGTIVGKTNCEDFCFSGAGYTSSLGPVANPFDATRSPGASSSGSAAVLAANEADLAIGGDQGGSIRLPASWSGVYGLKPTYGLVPYTGCATMENTIDHVGPMANNAEGLARLLQATAGTDPLDPRQRGVIPATHNTDYLSQLKNGIEGKKIALVREGFAQDGKDVGFPPSDPEVDRRVEEAVRSLTKLGAIVEEISLPRHLDGYYIWSLIITLGSSEFMIKGAGIGSNWAGYYNTELGEALTRGLRTRPNDLPAAAIMVLLAGDYLQSRYGGRYYWKAQNQRHLIRDAYDAAFKQYDMLAMPTTPFTATKQVDRKASLVDYVAPTLNMLRNTCVADITGHPSISIPCGMVGGLPVGLMLTGRHLEDTLLMQAAAAFETLGDWRKM